MPLASETRHPHRPVMLPELIQESDVLQSWARLINKSEPRRVVCGDESISWTERTISSDSSVARFFASETVLGHVRCFDHPLRRTPVKTTLWASCYQLGEFIEPHRDRGGDVQIIFCLKSTSVDEGGALCLQLESGIETYQLRAGDAILFCATETEHWTTPLIQTKKTPPSRVTIACRYWLT